MDSDSDSVDSREGQLLDMRAIFDYGSGRRNIENRHPSNLVLCEKLERPPHDSSLLSQFFWGLEDEEMESRPPEKKRRCRRRWMRGTGHSGVRHKTFENLSTNWHDLPMELLIRVLSLVDNRTVVTASGVCRGWRDSIGQGIHELSFSWCGHSVSNLVQSVAPRFPRLRSCRLKRCFYLDDAAIEIASKHWHGLKALELSDGIKLSDAAMYALANGCPMLEKLDLSGCKGITEAGLLALVQHCNNLRHLNLWGCYNAGTDKVLQALAMHCKGLQSLNLGLCEYVTDKGIVAFARGCPDLRVIDLCGCKLITDQSVIFLSDNCLHLCALGLSTCKNLTDLAMYTLIKTKAATTSQATGKRKRFSGKSVEMTSDFRVPRHRICATSSCSSSGSTCSDASKLPIKREGLDTLLEENPNQHGLVCLNVSHCESLSAQAVQAVCDAFPDLHTCAELQSLVTSGCLNLTSVDCICAIEARMERSRRERRVLFALG